MNALLRDLYHDISNPAGLGSIRQLYLESKKRNKKITWRDIKQFLQQSRTYTLNNPTRKRFPRRKILVPKHRVIMTCDLGDLSVLQRHNRGVKYFLFCLDVFSRYLQVTPLTIKSATSTLTGLLRILESEKSKGILRFFTDIGFTIGKCRIIYLRKTCGCTPFTLGRLKRA